jgi:hypothetical protein
MITMGAVIVTTVNRGRTNGDYALGCNNTFTGCNKVCAARY